MAVSIGGRSIGVFNVDGRYYAIRNRCPHQGAELCLGRVVRPAVRARQPGVFVTQPGPPWLQCPWHGWEFNLETGGSWFDPKKTRVRSYPVAVEHLNEAEEGAVAVNESLRVETYAVHVEADYVVIDF